MVQLHSEQPRDEHGHFVKKPNSSWKPRLLLGLAGLVCIAVGAWYGYLYGHSDIPIFIRADDIVLRASLTNEMELSKTLSRTLDRAANAEHAWGVAKTKVADLETRVAKSDQSVMMMAMELQRALKVAQGAQRQAEVAECARADMEGRMKDQQNVIYNRFVKVMDRADQQAGRYDQQAGRADEQANRTDEQARRFAEQAGVFDNNVHNWSRAVLSHEPMRMTMTGMTMPKAMFDTRGILAEDILQRLMDEALPKKNDNSSPAKDINSKK